MTPTPTSERNTKMVSAVRSGQSLRAVGKANVITHERVRQIVQALDPEAIAAGMRVRAEADHERQTAALPPLLEKVCPVCEQAFTTTDARRITDSSSCAQLWAKGFRFTTPQGRADHLARVATSFLRKPDKYGEVRVRWAERHLTEAGIELPEEYVAWKAAA